MSNKNQFWHSRQTERQLHAVSRELTQPSTIAQCNDAQRCTVPIASSFRSIQQFQLESTTMLSTFKLTAHLTNNTNRRTNHQPNPSTDRPTDRPTEYVATVHCAGARVCMMLAVVCGGAAVLSSTQRHLRTHAACATMHCGRGCGNCCITTVCYRFVARGDE